MISAASSPASEAQTSHYAGLGTSEAGAQIHLLTFGPAILALQGNFRLPATSAQTNAAQIGNTSRDADLRLLSGLVFDLGRIPSFVNLETGYRLRSGGAPAEWHWDATLGVHVLPRWLLLVQSFTVIGDGSGTPWFPAASSSKLGCAVVYDVTARWSVELGLFQTILGWGALRERGVKAALWYRF